MAPAAFPDKRFGLQAIVAMMIAVQGRRLPTLKPFEPAEAIGDDHRQ